MLHQFKKNQMITRSKRGSFLDKIEIFMANAERVNREADQTNAFIQDCIKHFNEKGNADVFRKSIMSVCANQLSSLNKLIIAGTGLAGVDKGFENPFSFIAALENIKRIASKMEEMIKDTKLHEIDEFNDDVAMMIDDMNEGHLAKRLKTS